MTTIAHRLQAIHAKLHQAKLDAGRANQSVQLLAVSKSQPVSSIIEAYEAGQRLFGENYLQECLDKQALLKNYAIEWHFIGPIQSNKTQAIAQHFDWVHSVDRLKIAQRLNQAREGMASPLNICLQINSSEEQTKSGLLENEVETLANHIMTMPNLRLRGLMAIPAPSLDINVQLKQFKKIHLIYQAMQTSYGFDTLSIGMSDDYEAAIAEGATIVRIGSAIFGARTYQQKSQHA